jgi:hypothetical protein
MRTFSVHALATPAVLLLAVAACGHGGTSTGKTTMGAPPVGGGTGTPLVIAFADEPVTFGVLHGV